MGFLFSPYLHQTQKTSTKIRNWLHWNLLLLMLNWYSWEQTMCASMKHSQPAAMPRWTVGCCIATFAFTFAGQGHISEQGLCSSEWKLNPVHPTQCNHQCLRKKLKMDLGFAFASWHEVAETATRCHNFQHMYQCMLKSTKVAESTCLVRTDTFAGTCPYHCIILCTNHGIWKGQRLDQGPCGFWAGIVCKCHKRGNLQ